MAITPLGANVGTWENVTNAVKGAATAALDRRTRDCWRCGEGRSGIGNDHETTVRTTASVRPTRASGSVCHAVRGPRQSMCAV
ncbi:MAG: hypothetical protein ACRDQI_01440 [Pseudonocardiaceae bacterium]